MASAAYREFSVQAIGGTFNWTSHLIKVVLVRSTYTPDFVNHHFRSSISSYEAGSPVTLTSKAVVNGAADCADFSFLAISGSAVKAMIFFRDTGVESTSPLLVYYDNAPQFPFTPTGGHVAVTVSNDVNRLFRIGS